LTTPGHLFPGLAVAEQLVEEDPRIRITFAGSGSQFERRHVAASGFEYLAIRCKPAPRRLRDALAFLTDNVAGYREAGRFLDEQQVDAVVGLGGYASAPMAKAAARRGTPLILLEQNAVPGKVTRWLAGSATMICVAMGQTRAKLRGPCPVRVTGNPVRAIKYGNHRGLIRTGHGLHGRWVPRASCPCTGEMLVTSGTGEMPVTSGTGETPVAPGVHGCWVPRASCPCTGEMLVTSGTGETPVTSGTGETPVAPDETPVAPGVHGCWVPRASCPCIGEMLVTSGTGETPVTSGTGETPVAPDERRRLLILGGSRGARSINEDVPLALHSIRAKLDGWQIVHQSGESDFPATVGCYRQLDLPAAVVPFIENVPAALAATDLAVSRAGGTTLAELSIAGVPAILLPYPHAADDHQRRNADVPAGRGAAVTLDERESSDPLADRLAGILGELLEDGARRARMSAAMRQLARPDAAAEVAELIFSVAGGRSLYRGEPVAA